MMSTLIVSVFIQAKGEKYIECTQMMQTDKEEEQELCSQQKVY